MKLKIWITILISFLLLVIASLTFLLSMCALEETFETNILDHNYRLFNLINEKRGQTILSDELNSGDWSMVCFLGPYSTDSSTVLGFDWDIEKYTDVLQSDGYNVLVFVNQGEVFDFIIQSRDKGDFSSLSQQCLNKGAVLKINQTTMNVTI